MANGRAKSGSESLTFVPSKGKESLWSDSNASENTFLLVDTTSYSVIKECSKNVGHSSISFPLFLSQRDKKSSRSSKVNV